MIRTLIRISLGLGLAAYAVAAQASGIALRQWSATGQGNAFAGGTAGAEDITSMAVNPAGITRHAGDHAAFNLSYIGPHLEFSDGSASTVLATPITGGDGGGDIGPDAVAPALYLSRQFSPDLFGGIAVIAPFGLATDYDDDWIGRYHGTESLVQTVEVNPVLAYKATPRLSLAGGLRVMYARGKLANAVDFGTLDALPVILGGFGGAFGGTPAGDDGFAEVDGDDFGLGYNLGLLYQLTEATRIGVAYRSRLLIDFEGDAEFDNGTVGGLISGASGLFVDTGFNAEFDFPETVSFGIHHEISPRWAVMAEAQWTRWSRVEELRVEFDNSLQPDNVITADWEDTWFFALGATYRHSPNLSFRFGVAYDQTPVPDRTRTPFVPDEDRTWVSVGLEYKVGAASHLSVGYTHFFVKDASLNLTTADPNNALRGNLSGEYEIRAEFLAVQYRSTF